MKINNFIQKLILLLLFYYHSYNFFLKLLLLFYYHCYTKINFISTVLFLFICFFNVLFNDTLNTFYLRLLLRHTYGKGPLR